MMATMLSVSVSSCGDDDDNEGGASGVPAPTLTDNNGKSVQVLSAGNVWFRYDEDGKIIKFGDSYESYELEGNAFEFTYEDAYTAKFTLNGSGLISKISMTCDLKGSGGYHKEKIMITYNYNSARQLIGASYSGSAEWKYTDSHGQEQGSASGTGSIKNTWSNGNLVKCVNESKISGKENGKSYNEHETGTYTFSYGNTLNSFKQFPYFMGDGTTGINGEGFSLFCIVGLYGVGPAYLPTGYVEEWKYEEDGDIDYETREYDLSFTLNADGTINTERRGNYEYISYQYGAVNRSVVEQAENLLPILKEKMSKMFKHTPIKK